MKTKLSSKALFALIPAALLACSEANIQPAQASNAGEQRAQNLDTDEHSQKIKPHNSYEAKAREKITELKTLMQKASTEQLDITREQSTLWFAEEFLKFANWDEANRDAVAYMFAQYAPYKEQKDQLAKELPDFERQKVIEILDASIADLQAVLNGAIKRRPVPKVDWQNIEVGDNMLLSAGKPIFLYDYFSKSVGRPLSDSQVYNDHLGAIFHGGENLYPVDHDRAINSFLLNEDGSFNEELMQEVTNIDNSNVGFLIYWNMGIPEWAEKQEPDIRKGRSLFTGYDIDNPLARDIWGKIASHTGELTRGKKVTQLGYILSNEPHWFSEKGHWSQQFQEMNNISTYTLDGFRQWLNTKYQGDINELNKNWNSAFTSFNDVNYSIPNDPATRGQPSWYDWSRYNMDRVVAWFSYLQGELRKGNPEADTSIKIMPDMFTENARSHGIDTEALTELTSMIGNDAKSRESTRLNFNRAEEWEQHYSWFWEELSFSYDFMESVAPEKIHVNSESHFLSASWWRKLDTSVDYVHSVYWLATLQGMDANMAWFWARDPDGSPEDRLEGELDFFDPALAGSFAGSVNQQPHIANAYTQVMYDLNSFSEEIIELRKQRRPIRLFYSETSAINKAEHMSQQWKLYESLFFDGFPVGFATKNILQKQDVSNWDLVVVHRHEYVTEEELAALQNYLDAGGTIILDRSSSLSMNEYGQKHPSPLQQSALSKKNQGKLMVLDSHEVQALRKAALNEVKASLPALTLNEDNGSAHPGTTWRVVEQSDGSYLVSALNIGKHTATLSVEVDGAQSLTITDLFTENPLPSSFELKAKGVALFTVKAQ
ncbi:glycoside hydrolase family 42 [Agaribacterium haliotis]|uniref:glycoside hydrolase family 42 n=1 Tax=Agaribacterium haliotis TaxID=2013869 RepID=UPI000BB59795|nr:glycoside hydrolase family 42 [Agaribacterium haliotis]